MRAKRGIMNPHEETHLRSSSYSSQNIKIRVFRYEKGCRTCNFQHVKGLTAWKEWVAGNTCCICVKEALSVIA